MKFLLVMYLAIAHREFDEQQHVMAVIPQQTFDTIEQCNKHITKEYERLPQYIIGGHCIQTQWHMLQDADQPMLLQTL